MIFFLSPQARRLSLAILALFVGLVALASAQDHAWAVDDERTYRVVAVELDDVLNIRAGPSAGHPIVGEIPPTGRGVQLLGPCREWCPIRYNGASGWVSGRYLAVEPAVAPFVRRLPPGELPTEDDWSDHLTTLFPEVRMKRFLEMRGADGGRWRRICALPALWTGLLYDATSLDAAWDLVKDWSAEERQALRSAVPKTALRPPFRRTTVLELARQALAIAQAGLKRRGFVNAEGQDERLFLEPVETILRNGLTPAEEILVRYEGEWGRRTDPLFQEYAF